MKKKEKDKFTTPHTVRFTEQMYSDIKNACEKQGISFMDWVRGACAERLSREKYNELTPVGQMSHKELETFICKVLQNSELEIGYHTLASAAASDRMMFGQERPFDLLDDLQMLSTEEECDAWAKLHLFPLNIELDEEDIPENVKIYGVLQGRIVYRDLNDGRIGCCRFDQMFEEVIAEDEDADSFVEDGSVVPAEDDSGA